MLARQPMKENVETASVLEMRRAGAVWSEVPMAALFGPCECYQQVPEELEADRVGLDEQRRSGVAFVRWRSLAYFQPDARLAGVAFANSISASHSLNRFFSHKAHCGPLQREDGSGV